MNEKSTTNEQKPKKYFHLYALQCIILTLLKKVYFLKLFKSFSGIYLG